MNNNVTYTRVEQFDIQLLQQAFAEGRLFITPPAASAEALREEGIRAILDYVSRIDDCTSSDYRTHIHDLWECILRDEQLGNLFFYTRYARNRGQVNWYRVTVVVCLLREWNVYRDDFTGSDLHCLLEGTKRRNNRYTGMNRYLLEGRYFGIIRKKLQQVKQ